MTTRPQPSRPAVPESETTRAYNALRTRIISAEIAPGERLKVESLKSTLGAGTAPIREALSLLTSDQLVERIDRRGFRVAATGPEQFAEILMLRCSLEDIALRTSIDKGGADWEEGLVLAHHRMARADRSDVRHYEEKHKAFHMALLEACASPILLRFCSQLYDLNIRYRYLAGRALTYSKRDVAREHADILEAVLDRDADLAAERLAAHYHTTGEFLAGQLAEAGSVADQNQVEIDP